LTGEWLAPSNFAFISHRWETEEHPDDEENSKLAQLKDLLEANKSIEYIWFDYCCVPQEPPSDAEEVENRTKVRDSLPFYITSCRNFYVLCGQGELSNVDEYLTRGWCRAGAVCRVHFCGAER